MPHTHTHTHTQMQAQGLSHYLMRRSLSQEEGARGWYMYVCVCVCVCAYMIYQHITICVVTLIRGHTL